MKLKEKNAIIKQAETLSDEELEKECYDSIYDSLGSITEDMYEMGYDMVDIVEQEKYEKYKSERAGILMNLCEKRGIKLFGE